MYVPSHYFPSLPANNTLFFCTYGPKSNCDVNEHGSCHRVQFGACNQIEIYLRGLSGLYFVKPTDGSGLRSCITHSVFFQLIRCIKCRWNLRLHGVLRSGVLQSALELACDWRTTGSMPHVCGATYHRPCESDLWLTDRIVKPFLLRLTWPYFKSAPSAIRQSESRLHAPRQRPRQQQHQAL